MSLEQQALFALYLVVAGFLSMVIGLDRENRDKSAGLRTHMLVGVGACLFTSLSVTAFPEADVARVAANVITGIGFLGAGVIFTGEDKVHNLTTAASIWVTAAMGMAVGVGAWFLALCTTILVWLILRILWHFRNQI